MDASYREVNKEGVSIETPKTPPSILITPDEKS